MYPVDKPHAHNADRGSNYQMANVLNNADFHARNVTKPIHPAAYHVLVGILIPILYA